MTTQPTDRFRQLIGIYGSYAAAAKAWGVEYKSLKRFFEDGGGLSGATIAAILERTGLPYERLFAHVDEKRPTQERKP